MKRLVIALSLASIPAILAGCPGDAGLPPGTDAGRVDARTGIDTGTGDTGGTTTDTGGTTADTGGTTDDGGGATDDGGGTTDRDGGGTIDPDGGTTDRDGGGTTDRDGGGTSDRDGGGTTGDAGGTTDRDGGVVVADAGARCRTNADCGIANSYCAKPTGMCSGFGTCMARPFACPDVVDPVCGCDGSDYGNECEAHAAGVNVLSRGVCGGTACTLPPTFGCCFDDGDCGGGGRCVNESCTIGGEGVCVGRLGMGECWEDSDCADGRSCVGARICPCGALCILPDAPGRCGFAPTPF